MPGANQPDADGNLPIGSYAGMQWSGGPGRLGMNVNGKYYPQAQLERLNGPQGDGYYVKPEYMPANTRIPNSIGVPAVANGQTGIKEGGSYFPQATQTGFEKQAGVSAPQYMSMLDADGNLKSPFVVDPTKSDSFNTMKQTANSTDLSPWAKMQQQSLGMQTAGLRDQTNAQQQGANDTAMQSLMTTGGGANSGARALVAAMGAKSNIMANQNIGSQAAGQDLGIQQADAQNKSQMLGQVANTETAAIGANAQSGINDLSQENLFSGNRYTQQMQAWGAKQAADAQRSAASSGGKK